MKSIEKLRKMDDGNLIAMGDDEYVRDTRHDRIADEIEAEIAELQASWAQEAREHADDSARLAELARENAELKREIAERYMELPVDADGVPIRVGDELCGYGLPDGGAIVKALNGTMVIVGRLEGGENYAKSGLLWTASETRHYKQRTLEDVLREFASRVLNSGHQWGLDAEAITVEYVDELCELMGGMEQHRSNRLNMPDVSVGKKYE